MLVEREMAFGVVTLGGGVQGLTDDEAKAKGPSFLFDDLRQREKDGKVAFNPMVLRTGVEPSADPMIAARAAPYAIGLGRRLTEGAKQQ